jgi:hypothetical protein
MNAGERAHVPRSPKLLIGWVLRTSSCSACVLRARFFFFVALAYAQRHPRRHPSSGSHVSRRARVPSSVLRIVESGQTISLHDGRSLGLLPVTGRERSKCTAPRDLSRSNKQALRHAPCNQAEPLRWKVLLCVFSELVEIHDFLEASLPSLIGWLIGLIDYWFVRSCDRGDPSTRKRNRHLEGRALLLFTSIAFGILFLDHGMPKFHPGGVAGYQ